MKKTKKMLGILLLAILTALSSQLAFAEYKDGARLPKSLTMRTGDYFFFTVKGKVKSVKTSKKSVAKASKHFKPGYVMFEARKPGKAKITVKSSKKKYTCKVTVKKYENPFQSFEIFGKDVTNVYRTPVQDGNDTCMKVSYGSKGTLSFKLKPGYTLRKITTDADDTVTYENNSVFTADETLFGRSEYAGFNIFIYDKLTKTTKDFYYTLQMEDFDSSDEDN